MQSSAGCVVRSSVLQSLVKAFPLIALLWLTLSSSSTVAALHRTLWFELEPLGYNFEHYVHEYGKVYSSSEEYELRKTYFNTYLSKVLTFNKRNETWKMGINRYSDHKPEEFRALLGYRHDVAWHARRMQNEFVSEHVPAVPVSALPKHVDWRTKNAVSAVKDQANCGSCWAFATASVLESFYFLVTGKMMLVSPQQIASCTDIPPECLTQGTGGCHGSSQIVALASIAKNKNTVSEFQYPYRSHDGDDFSCVQHTGISPLRIKGYKVVPMNNYEALMDAVANQGPVTISVDANDWDSYESGIFTGCSTTIDVDHAVQLVGYGEDDTGAMYWIIRNQWGTWWGEKGYMRLARDPNAGCSIDQNARDCLGGPTSPTVCGACGILYDNAYPIIDA